MVKQGGFREDLYYRLNVVGIRMPPLRERTEDIGLLASHFIDYCARQMSRPARGLSPDAMALMLAHDWPGNVRELANAIERAVAVGRGEIIEPCDLPLEARPCREAGTGKTLHEVEQRHVAEILEQNGWNISRAATTLGIDRVTLYKKMRRFGIQRPARPAGR